MSSYLISNVRGPISSSSKVSKLKKAAGNQFRLDTLTTGLGIVFAPRIRWMAMSRFLARKRNLLESFNRKKEEPMSTILIIILILLLVGALPSWPYSSGWGYYPSGGLGLILLIVIILLLMGRL